MPGRQSHPVHTEAAHEVAAPFFLKSTSHAYSRDDGLAKIHISELGPVFTVFAQEHVDYTRVKDQAPFKSGPTVSEL